MTTTTIPDVPVPAGAVNLADALIAPEVLRPFIENWEEVAVHFLRSVQADAVADRTTETAELLQRLLAYPDLPPLSHVAPLETHDPGQDPQKGGLVYAKYGRGVYVYVAFALYRQLPDGVPGAYRLFANLLSLPRNPAFKQPAGTNNSARR